MTSVIEKTLSIKEVKVPGYEKILFVTDEKTGLQAIICLHNSTLGPTLGGTRIYPYDSFEAALNDAKRLSRGMTYKSAIAETGLGGAKSVIIADAKKKKREEILLAFGQAVHTLKGNYICAEDFGCTTEDVMMIRKATPYVVGLIHEKSSGDPGLFTAWGTLRGIQATAKAAFGSDSLEGKRIAIQGLGSVGQRLLDHLFWAGAKLFVTDIDRQKIERAAKLYRAEGVEPEKILSLECDILSPCALGAVINPQTIAQMRCRAIAGSANNQLLFDSDAEELMRRKILYAPDFVINAGGLINVTQEIEFEGYDPQKARDRVNRIYDGLQLIFRIADQNKISTHAAAIALADYRLKYGIGRRTNPIYLHHAKSF